MKKILPIVIAIIFTSAQMILAQNFEILKSFDEFIQRTTLLDRQEIPLATISTGFISSPLCAGNLVSVPYTVSGSFNPGNVFTAQLSNTSGSFSLPIPIGSVTSTNSGIINAVISGYTPYGTGYRIRVVGSDPYTVGTDNGMNIIINTKPNPVINGSNTACMNSSQTFSTISTPGNSYTWQAYGGLIVGNNHSTNILVNWTTSNPSGTVTLAETNDLSGCLDSTYLTVSFNPLPSPSISGTGTVCNKSTQTYTCPVVAGHSYSWSAGGGSIVGTNNNTADVYWNTLNSTGIVSVQETINSTGCSATSSKTITINPLPAPMISGDFDVCNNSIQNYSTTFTPNINYQWKTYGGNIIGNNNQTNVSVNWNTSLTSSTITLIETNQGTLCKDSAYQIVNILPIPVPSFTGTDVSFKDSTEYYTTSPINGNSILWKVAGGQIIGPRNNVEARIKWETPPSGTITLIQTVDATGCQDSIYRVVTIKPFSPYISGAESTCENKTENYSAQSVSGASYAWTVTGGNVISALNQPSMQVKWFSPGTGKISLIITINSSGYKDSSEKDVTINPVPAIPLLFGPLSSCVNKIETYSTSQLKGFTLKWQAENGFIVNEDDQPDVKVRWLSEPSGTITLTKAVAYPYNSCSSSTFQVVNVYALPSPVIEGTTTAVRNTIEHYSVNNNEGSKYQWEVIGGSITGADTVSEADILWGNDNSGVLTAIETNSNGCTDSSVITVSLSVNSVNYNFNPYSIKLYPNPTSGSINFELSCNAEDFYEIDIVNIYGETVRNIYDGIIEAGIFKTSWDGTNSELNKVSSGIYFLSVKSKVGLLTDKIVILR